jgi:hypothetical protein
MDVMPRGRIKKSTELDSIIERYSIEMGIKMPRKQITFRGKLLSKRETSHPTPEMGLNG